MTLLTESVVDQTDHFAAAFVHGNVAYANEVDNDNDILMLLQRLQCKFG